MYDRNKDLAGTDPVVAAVEDCAHHNAAQLAQGSDSAESVAKTVVEMCLVEIDAWAKQPVPGEDIPFARRRASVVSEIGQEARLEVLRDRAGHCPAPENSN